MAKETKLQEAREGGSWTVSATMRAKISYGSRVGGGGGSEELMLRKDRRKVQMGVEGVERGRRRNQEGECRELTPSQPTSIKSCHPPRSNTRTEVLADPGCSPLEAAPNEDLPMTARGDLRMEAPVSLLRRAHDPSLPRPPTRPATGALRPEARVGTKRDMLVMVSSTRCSYQSRGRWGRTVGKGGEGRRRRRSAS